MHIDRSLLNWGVFLIALGGIPLAVDEGWLEIDIAQDLGQLWPLILVGIGLGLILRWTPLAWFGGALVAATIGVILGAAVVTVRDNELTGIQGIIPSVASATCASGDVGDASTSEGGLTGAGEFELDVTFSCGELEIGRASTAAWALEARHETDDAPRVEQGERDGATASLRLSQDGGDGIVLLGWQVQSMWDVELPAEAALRIDTTLNAAKGTIDTEVGPVERVAGTFNASDVVVDLASASTPALASVELTLNASDGHLALPAADVDAGLTLNASSLSICIPADAALRIDHSSVLGSDDLASSGLTEESSGQWVTPGIDEAGARVSLSITNTVSSVSIERPEACS